MILGVYQFIWQDCDLGQIFTAMLVMHILGKGQLTVCLPKKCHHELAD